MINFITISAPSGAGKTTLCKALRSVQPDIEWSISHTTRSKRDIEIDGVDYHFITIEKFEELILEEAFADLNSKVRNPELILQSDYLLANAIFSLSYVS